jgi:hypothetical protein
MTKKSTAIFSNLLDINKMISLKIKIAAVIIDISPLKCSSNYTSYYIDKI